MVAYANEPFARIPNEKSISRSLNYSSLNDYRRGFRTTFGTYEDMRQMVGLDVADSLINSKSLKRSKLENSNV